SATEDTNSDLPPIPSLLGGPGISTAFQSELQRSNYLRGGINVSALYDDNPLLLSTGVESNTSETIFPSISIDESTPRTRWTLGYAGGLTVDPKIERNHGRGELSFCLERPGWGQRFVQRLTFHQRNLRNPID